MMAEVNPSDPRIGLLEIERDESQPLRRLTTRATSRTNLSRASQLLRTGPCTLEQQITLAYVSRQRRRPLELTARLLESAQLPQKVTPDARQEMVLGHG